LYLRRGQWRDSEKIEDGEYRKKIGNTGISKLGRNERKDEEVALATVGRSHVKAERRRWVGSEQ
jgi:hypothetical protein